MVKNSGLGMNNFLKRTWYVICKYLLILLPKPVFYQVISFVNYTRIGTKWYLMNLRHPKTFNEKLNYLKLYERPTLGTMVADKVYARKYVKETIGPDYLVPLIAVYDRVDEVKFEDLPNKFALKTNHGSGWNLICKDKNQIDWYTERKKLEKWLSCNAYYLSREWQYQAIVPKLICEELLSFEINDYKFFCSKGKAQLIQVDNARFSNHQRTLFDLEWKPVDIRIRYPQIQNHIPRPKRFEEMIRIAEKLSNPFRFCRIDLYENNDQVYFGEITLHPGGGMEPFASYEEDLNAGQLIDLRD